MKLSKMVEENITSEEVKIIEEKKKCKKKKALMEEGMKYCAKCGAEYDEALEACPACEATETFSKCESIDLRIAKNEAKLTAGSVEDEVALTAKIESLKSRKEEECTEEETPVESPVAEAKKEKGVIFVTCVECKHEYAATEDKCPKCGCAAPVTESEEVIAEADILVETPTTDEAADELEYLKSLSGM